MSLRTWVGATVAVVAILVGTARGQSVQVWGGPSYTPGVGGHIGYSVPHTPGWAVSDSGIAISNFSQQDGTSRIQGSPGFRWDASGAVTELGSLGADASGKSSTYPCAVNGAGTVVGYGFKYDGAGVLVGRQAVRWDATGRSTELGNLGSDSAGKTDSYAYAINGAGTTVGSSKKFDAVHNYWGTRAVRWDAPGIAATELDDLAPGVMVGFNAAAYAVNAGGTVVGYSTATDGFGTRAVRWDSGGTAATELGSLGLNSNPVNDSCAYAVNATGTAVGYARKQTLVGNTTFDWGDRAVRWDASSAAAIELGNLGTHSGSTRSYAYAINDAGTTVGYASKYDALGNNLGTRAVRWDASGTTATELGSLQATVSGSNDGWAYAINSAGVSVGYANVYNLAGTAYLGQHAVYWGADGAAVDLNNLVPLNGPDYWMLTQAYVISDTGYIVGTAYYFPDVYHSSYSYQRLFLMQVPAAAAVPEPACLSLLAMGGVGLLRRRR